MCLDILDWNWIVLVVFRLVHQTKFVCSQIDAEYDCGPGLIYFERLGRCGADDWREIGYGFWLSRVFKSTFSFCFVSSLTSGCSQIRLRVDDL